MRLCRIRHLILWAQQFEREKDSERENDKAEMYGRKVVAGRRGKWWDRIWGRVEVGAMVVIRIRGT